MRVLRGRDDDQHPAVSNAKANLGWAPSVPAYRAGIARIAGALPARTRRGP
jgi:hypothetical protein